MYQQFCDRNLALKKREDELQQNVDELEAKKTDLQKTRHYESPSESQDNIADSTYLNLKAKLEEIIANSNVSLSHPNTATNYDQNENYEILNSSLKVEPSSRTLIFDTKDLF